MSSAFRVTGSSGYVGWLALVAVALGLAGCGGSGSGGSAPPPPATYTLGGTVSGRAAAGLVLANNGATVTVNSGATTFSFATPLATGTAYAVTVQTTPNGLTCSVAGGTGTIGSANVSNVVVTCSDKAYALGGTIQNLTVPGLVLANGSDTLHVPANSTTFAMPTAVAFTSTYAVTVSTQPAGETCSVSSGAGTMPANDLANVTVTCATAAYTLGGTISGLTVAGLILANGSDRLTVMTNAAVFTMPTPVAYNSPYAVTIAAQPVGLMCSIMGGSGTMPGTVVNSVQVSCSPRQWTWEGGPNTATPGPTGTQKGVYGSLGVADSMNRPGARDNAMTWTDSNRQFWLFGGTAVDSAGTVGDINDLWSYDPTARKWKWVSGSSTVGAVGTYGTPPATGVPAARHGGMTWTDTAGNLWLYGGAVPDPANAANPPLFLNDLWSYNISSNTWTLVNGSNSTDVGPVYGSQGGAAPGNTPGGRQGAASWIDSGGHLWLFGGRAVNTSAQPIYFADLWSFDPGSKEWTWMSGSNVASDPGTYGTKGTPSASNVPPARYGAASWIDSHGALWLFGGGYTDPTGAIISGLNDLWVYTPSTGWDWVGGSNGANGFGTYGTAGVANASTVPGARGGSVVWTDNEGHVWLYGGLGAGATRLPTANQLLSDLWTFDPGSLQWTFVSGAQEPNTDAGAYVLPGGSGTSKPSGRASAAAWADGSGHIWMFGGTGFDSAGTAADLNDLWMF